MGIGDWGLPNPQSPIPNPQLNKSIQLFNYSIIRVIKKSLSNLFKFKQINKEISIFNYIIIIVTIKLNN